MARTPPVGLQEEIGKGVAYMLAAVALFSVMSALVKATTANYPVGQVMFFRNGAALPMALLIMAGTGGFGAIRTQRKLGHLGRALTGFCGMGAGFFALSLMPLVDATALSFTQPMFLALLAIPMLGERVGIHRALAIVAGFIGVLVLSLGQGGFRASLGAVGLAAALANAALSACSALLVRMLSASESSATITVWQSLLMTLLSALLLPFGWVTPGWIDALLLLGIGACGGIAQYWMTQGYRFGPASVNGAFNYTGIVWAVLLGWLLWDELPGPAVIAGSAIVIAAGLYILQREVFRGRHRAGR